MVGWGGKSVALEGPGNRLDCLREGCSPKPKEVQSKLSSGPRRGCTLSAQHPRRPHRHRDRAGCWSLQGWLVAPQLWVQPPPGLGGPGGLCPRGWAPSRCAGQSFISMPINLATEILLCVSLKCFSFTVEGPYFLRQQFPENFSDSVATWGV